MLETVSATIGLSPLLSSLTPRRPSVEVVAVKRTDEDASGCWSCPGRESGRACSSCPKRVVTTEYVRRYHSEKSKYGDRAPLSRGALLLFSYVHFLDPDSNGLVRRISVRRAASVLGCSERTVANNLRNLDELGYLAVSPLPSAGHWQAFISGYDKYHAAAPKGGRGFLRLSFEAFRAFASMKDVNSIRLAIRAVADASEGVRGFASERAVAEIRSDLPRYVTKRSVEERLGSENFRAAFDVAVEDGLVSVRLKPEYDAAVIGREAREEFAAEFESEYASRKKARGGKRPARPNFSKREMDDVSSICLRYPVAVVMAAVSEFVETYVRTGLRYDSAGALVRSFASKINASITAAA